MTGICGLPISKPKSQPKDQRAVEQQGDAQPCPCDSGRCYGDCCGPVIAQKTPAATAEALMRSRYCAYVLGDAEYLLTSWCPQHRPVRVDFDPAQRWLGLKIKQASKGGSDDTEGTVEFVARYKVAGKGYRLHERSCFRQEAGQWYYVDGEQIT